jgi:hypothetical protein
MLNLPRKELLAHVLFERGACHKCGHEQPVTEGGYLLDVVPRG